ncbi:cupin domain-containing protein [Polynucleobacter arcticus]|uniref:Cupin n=1 Tax=Polynucleobacter arcticus TaxID=1743165 RepID=A0A6M9PZS0_9BURK|nr:cupin domain-containing protein [Polynucleobacter arcticus]QKM61413.1 cupin [Polynucleobacter arcticus]
MNINSDFSQKVVLNTSDLDWDSSPVPGVERKYLDRIGDELARASSIVKYSPESSFTEHIHVGGEEIFVLEGTFSDEGGDYPSGTYIRNPPSSKHTPYSQEGCVLFVKLRQFNVQDTSTVKINTATTAWHPGLVPGLSVMPLHEFDGVGTALVHWAPNTMFNPHVHPGGEEILVLKGVFHDEHGSYPTGTWIRSPRYSKHAPFTKSEGALIYVKTGHLHNPL